MDEAEFTVTPRFPFFIITDDGKRPVISEQLGRACFIAYQTLELAELYLAEAGQGFTMKEVDASGLFVIGRDNPKIRFVAWNNMAKAQTFVFVPIEKFFW